MWVSTYKEFDSGVPQAQQYKIYNMSLLFSVRRIY